MNFYRDVILDTSGNIIPAVTVTVTQAVSNNPATLYSEHTGSTPLGNPITTNSDGSFSFWTDDGLYNLTPSKPGYSIAPLSNIQIGPNLPLRIGDLSIDRVLGTNGGRFELGPAGASASTQSAQLQLVPGSSVDHANQIASQIMIFNKSGVDYERFSFSAVNDVYIIDSSYNNNGTSRDILFQVGGRVDPTPIAGRNGIQISADASVAIHASNYTADGKTWGSSRARFVDPGNAGDTRIQLDTRTGTPASNTADSAHVEYARGGVRKWQIGLNVGGANADTFDFYDSTGAAVRMSITPAGIVSPTRLHLEIVATGSLPGAAASMDGTILIEDAGAGDRNLIIYAGGQRFRIDGGASV